MSLPPIKIAFDRTWAENGLIAISLFVAGRKVNQNGSISVTIVIIISWLVMGMVVFALAQYSTLRRISQEEEEEEEAAAAAEAAALVRSQLAKPPIMQTTPPTPSPQSNGGGGSILSPASSSARSTTAVSSSSMSSSSSKSIWLPSVGALQLSDSSILKRRESAKRKRKAKQNRYKYFLYFWLFRIYQKVKLHEEHWCLFYKTLFFFIILVAIKAAFAIGVLM